MCNLSHRKENSKQTTEINEDGGEREKLKEMGRKGERMTIEQLNPNAIFNSSMAMLSQISRL